MPEVEHAFENEVRRIARLLWPVAQYDGASVEDDRERDGIFETDDFVHIIECTISRGRDKAREDASKIAKLIRKIVVRRPTKFIKGWFITRDEPTAEQRAVVKEVTAHEKLQSAQVVAVSFDQFRTQLVDARTYLDRRRDYPFGSVRDPTTGAPTFDLQYTPLVILDQVGNEHTAAAISRALLEGVPYVLQGDYGAGKSATMRELFLRLANKFRQKDTLAFPILLNLRDHHGQTDPVEALERHARRIGFADPAALVRAWRGGFAVLLLDGFDEIAAAGWAGKTKTLKELRHRSMELVRSFVRDSPEHTGIVLSGRAHFFDSQREMETALGLRAGFTLIHLTEFNEEQLAQFLKQHGWHEPVPDWIPSRPLLLTYLVSRKLLTPEVVSATEADPAAGWDDLLNRILQRLPGLGASQAEDGSRVFLDADFVEAARGGALARIIENPYVLDFDTDSWQSSVTPLAAQVAALRVQRAGYKQGMLLAALRHCINRTAFTSAADLVQVSLELYGSIGEEAIYIREVIVPEFRFDDPSTNLSGVQFQDSVIGTFAVSPDFPAEQLPIFVRTHFGEVEGRTGAAELPPNHFIDCDYDTFEEPARTTNAIMSLALPLGTKVM